MMTLDRRQKISRFRFDLNYGEGAADELLAMARQFATIADMRERFSVKSTQQLSVTLDTLLGESYASFLARHGIRRQGVKREEK